MPDLKRFERSQRTFPRSGRYSHRTASRPAWNPTNPAFIHWEQNLPALVEAVSLDGYYVLVANLPAEEYDTSAVLRLHTGQCRTAHCGLQETAGSQLGSFQG